MSHLPIYLDYAATTPVDPKVITAMTACLGVDGAFGNPASATHVYGWHADELIQQAREQVAALVNCDPREIIWTSGATEADNLAIIGAANFFKSKKNHIITVKTEHKAVLDVCAHLQAQDFEITYLNVDKQGRINLDELTQAIRPQTVLVSVMHVNNELGVIQDIEAIGKITRAHKVYLHVDAAQSLGKLPIDLATLPVDLMSFSAHKLYGPKGMGALFVRRKPKVRLQALIYGGGHEQGLRSGTLATHQIVGFGQACALRAERMSDEMPRLTQLRDLLWSGLQQIDGVSSNTYFPHALGSFLNVSFAGVDGEALILGLNKLAVSAGSACNSTTIEPSHVLQAIGVPAHLAHASVRFSVGQYTTEQDIEMAIEHIQTEVKRLRGISPLWQVSPRIMAELTDA